MNESPIPDMYGKIQDESTFLGKIASKIPGFSGYVEKSRRREADEILRRVAHYEDRPLLAGNFDEKKQKVQNLLRQRRPAYAAILHQIDTTQRTPDEIIAQIEDALAAEAELAGMKRITVRNPEGSYHICLGEGLLAEAGTLLRNRKLRPGATALVTNDKMPSQHVDTLRQSLTAAGYEVALRPLVWQPEEASPVATG